MIKKELENIEDKKIKEKIIPLVNKLPRLSAKAALKEIPISQADQAKQELNRLENQLKEIAILLKGLKLEEHHYIGRISQANRILGSEL